MSSTRGTARTDLTDCTNFPIVKVGDEPYTLSLAPRSVRTPFTVATMLTYLLLREKDMRYLTGESHMERATLLLDEVTYQLPGVLNDLHLVEELVGVPMQIVVTG